MWSRRAEARVPPGAIPEITCTVAGLLVTLPPPASVTVTLNAAPLSEATTGAVKKKGNVEPLMTLFPFSHW